MNREDLNSLLYRFTISNVQLRRNRKTEALNSWQTIVNAIVEHVKRNDRRFAKLRILPTGSYYERAKVGEPDEFDLMLEVDNLELDDEPFDEDDGLREPPTGTSKEISFIHAWTLILVRLLHVIIWYFTSGKGCRFIHFYLVFSR